MYRMTPINKAENIILLKLPVNFLKLKPFKCLRIIITKRMLYIPNPIANPIENHSIPYTGAMNIVISATIVREKMFMIIGVIVFFIA